MPQRHGSLTGIILAGCVAVGIVLALTGSVFAQSAVTPPGSGAQTNPYLISEVGHLVWMQANAGSSSGKYYTMTADIDTSATATWNDAGTDTSVLEGFKPIGTDGTPFTGVFDGNGHTITGLAINRPSTDYLGLFGYLGTDGQVRNLGMVGGRVAGRAYVSGLAGANDGTLSNSFVTRPAVVGGGAYVGGLSGCSTGTVSNCCAGGVVEGTSNVGGLVGANYGGTVLNSYATSSVTGRGGYSIGGLVGFSWIGSVSGCYAAGAVTGTKEYVGGLIGCMDYTTVSNCYATGAVTGLGYVGGLIGSFASSTVSYCYSTGRVAAQYYFGGLVGVSYAGVSDSYWDIQTSKFRTSAGGIGKPTVGMKQQATFDGWDFNSTWAIDEGHSYPYLRFSPPPFTLTVGVSGPGVVTVDPSAADGKYAAGTVVTLTATSTSADYSFIRWTGAEPSASATVSVVMDIHRAVIAVFQRRIEINSLADLVKIGKDPAYPIADVLYVLTTDIDASETAGWNDAGTDTTVLEGFKPIGDSSTPFTGVFDGNGHTLTGLVTNRATTNDVGLFGYVGTNGQVRNLRMVGGAITGNGNVGGLVGLSSIGAVSNCCATGPVTGLGSHVGGLVGYNCSGTLSNCYATGAVSGTGTHVGGLTGDNGGCAAASNCCATGAVTGGVDYVGGLAGYNESTADVLNCYATGSVTGAASCVGGLLGYCSGLVSGCYATGAVSGSSFVGGLVGRNVSFVPDVLNSYWDTQTTGQASSPLGIGKTTTEMKQQATFVDWDFATVWGIRENVTDPQLRSAAIDSDGDGVSDWEDNCPWTANHDQADADGDGVGDSCDSCPGTPAGAAVDVEGCSIAGVPGDVDRDNDVDQQDFGFFQACLTAVGVPLNDPTCRRADMNGDNSVNRLDLNFFLKCRSGADIPANSDCAK